MPHQDIPGAPDWLNKLSGLYHGYDEFSKMFLAGAGDFARTQVAAGLNNASGNLGRMNENLWQMDSNLRNTGGQIGQGISNLIGGITRPAIQAGVAGLNYAFPGVLPDTSVQGTIQGALNNPAIVSQFNGSDTSTQGTIQGALNNPTIIRHFLNSVPAQPASAALPGAANIDRHDDPRSRFLPLGARRIVNIPNPGPMKPKPVPRPRRKTGRV